MNICKLNLVGMLLCSFLLSSCSLLDTHQLHDKAQTVKIYSEFEEVKGCQFINDFVSSEGTWYNFLFLSNKELTLASINDLKNQANAMGANTIYIQNNFSFNTSVTFWGQGYYCKHQ